MITINVCDKSDKFKQYINFFVEREGKLTPDELNDLLQSELLNDTDFINAKRSLDILNAVYFDALYQYKIQNRGRDPDLTNLFSEMVINTFEVSQTSIQKQVSWYSRCVALLLVEDRIKFI